MALLTLSATTAVCAQQEVGTWSIIPRVGLNLSTQTNNNVTIVSGYTEELKPKHKPGMKVGVDVEYQVSRPIALSAGVFYSMLGNRYSDVAAYEGTSADDPQTECYTGYSSWKNDCQYITVPLMMHGYVMPNLALKIGLQVGYLLKSEEKVDWESFTVDKNGVHTYTDQGTTESDYTDNAHRVDFAIPVGLSYEYENVMLDARYVFGLNNVSKVLSTKNNTFEVTVGYRFVL